MAYTITLTDGTVFATIADGATNTSSSMTLIGKNYAGYGQFLDDNFIRLLENGSNTSAPGAPLTGQLWWDKTNNLLKVYNGTTFKTISAATASASAPSSNVTGDLWYDTTNQQLKVWTGSAFIVVGPAYSASQGTSGAIPETITDSVGATKYITSLYVNNNRVGIVYDSSSFVPQASLLATFPTIYPGITLTTTNSPTFAGTANNASYLNSLTSSQFMRSDANTATTGRLQINNANGIYVGTANAVQISQSSNDGLVAAPISGGNLVLQANVGGSLYDVARALGANGAFAVSNAATVGTTLNVTGNATGGNLLTAGQVSATGNITGGNVSTTLVTATTLSSTANVQGGNLRTTGVISSTGNITAAGNITGNYLLGNGSQLTGLSLGVSVSKIENGTSKAEIDTSGGNLAVTIGGTANVIVVDTSTLYANRISATGNIVSSANVSGGNLVTGGVVSATANVQGGNIRTTGLMSSTGNIDGGNLRTGGLISATGNVDGGNLRTGGLISATGNVIGGNITTGAQVSATGNITGGNITTGAQVSATGNITGGNIVTVGNVSTTANVVSGNIQTAGLITVTGNVTGGNILTGGLISATGNITTAGYFVGAFAGTISGNLTVPGSNTQVIYNNNGNAAASAGFTFDSSANAVVATGNVTGGNLVTAGLITSTGNVTGGNLRTGGQVSATANVTGGNIITAGVLQVNGGGGAIAIVNGAANATGNIGSETGYFNRIFAQATTALYADVAERFAADEALDPGTVVELGGMAEITKSRHDLSENVFGVISTNAAYLMNGGAGEDRTHPPVAMTGRVPVTVIGKVRKGDRLVSAGNGMARSARSGEATAFNVIGRALRDKSDDAPGSIEAIVTIK